MPYVFLSPSTQEWNKYASSGNEEQYMNLIADRMEPYMRASGIRFSRNDPDKNVAGAINSSNSDSYDVHFALHSNAAPEQYSGLLRGIDIYYSPRDNYSQTLAVITANNLKSIYPIPDKVVTIPTNSLGEVTQTRAVAVLCELGYHDNLEDEKWIKNNLSQIAANLVQSLCDYFGIPFVEAGKVRTGVASTGGGNLNIRKFPASYSMIIGSIPDNAEVTVYGKTGNWYVVGYNNIIGYASADFIII